MIINLLHNAFTTSCFDMISKRAKQLLMSWGLQLPQYVTGIQFDTSRILARWNIVCFPGLMLVALAYQNKVPV